MTTHDRACFELRLEKQATEEEQTLPYAKQVEAHILWLSGIDNGINLSQIPAGALGEPQ